MQSISQAACILMLSCIIPDDGLGNKGRNIGLFDGLIYFSC